jgi:hypothetical protein
MYTIPARNMNAIPTNRMSSLSISVTYPMASKRNCDAAHTRPRGKRRSTSDIAVVRVDIVERELRLERVELKADSEHSRFFKVTSEKHPDSNTLIE